MGRDRWPPQSWQSINMQRKWVVSVIAYLTLMGQLTPSWAQTRAMESPQSQMISAKLIALGGANPAIKDAATMMINPAILGQIDFTPIGFTTQAFLGSAIDYKVLHIAIPFDLQWALSPADSPQRITFGLSYGSSGMSNIPETIYDSNRIFQVGSYGAGFDLIHVSAGTPFYGLFGSQLFSVGVGGKLLRQYIQSDSRIGFGLDTGLVANYPVSGYGINRLSIGLSFLNLLGSSMTWGSNQLQSTMPFQLLFGLQANLLDDDWTLHFTSGPRGITIGSEFSPQEMVSLRGSVGPNELNMGLGLQFNNVVAGFNNDDYALRFDYAYNQLLGSMDDMPSNSLSITILGSSRPSTPRILSPKKESITQETVIAVSGIGPPKTAIQLYANGSLIRTTQTDRYGNWSYPTLPLTEGKNRVYITAYDIAKESSVKSDPVEITRDTTAPTVLVSLSPIETDQLSIIVSSNEALAQLEGGIDGTPIGLQSADGLLWTGRAPYPTDLTTPYGAPTQLKVLQLVFKDKVGNQGAIEEFPFFAKVPFPQDMSIHYYDAIRIFGTGSTSVKMVYINGNLAKMDRENNFSLVQPLKLGKNTLRMVLKTDGSDINHQIRVLRLKSFSDLGKIKERREIEFMATLGVIDGEKDGRFYPDREVTRRYMATLLATQSGVALPKPSGDVFPDVKRTDPQAAAIAYVIDNGLMYAFPDGSFKPDRALTSSEVLSLLASAGIIDDQTSEVEDDQITRKQLARLLALNPRFDSQIEALVDWESGY